MIVRGLRGATIYPHGYLAECGHSPDAFHGGSHVRHSRLRPAHRRRLLEPAAAAQGRGPGDEGLLRPGQGRPDRGRAGREDQGADRAGHLGGGALRRLHRLPRPHPGPPGRHHRRARGDPGRGDLHGRRPVGDVRRPRDGGLAAVQRAPGRLRTFPRTGPRHDPGDRLSRRSPLDCAAMSDAEPPEIARTLTLHVAVTMQRERAPNRWEDWRHAPVAVDLDEGGLGTAARPLRDDGQTRLTLHPGLPLLLHADEGEGYHLNLSSGTPVWFVMWRVSEEDPAEAVPERVTLSYNEAGRLLDAQERVDPVPLPPAVVEMLQAFTGAHYRPEPKQRRRPASFRAPGERR